MFIFVSVISLVARNPKKIKGRTAFFLFCDNLKRYCFCTTGHCCIPIVNCAVLLLMEDVVGSRTVLKRGVLETKASKPDFGAKQ